MSSSEFTLRTSGGQTGPRDDRPLTEEEQKLVQRLLADPFAFPIAFKQWLVAFIESSEMTLPMGTIAGLNSALGIGVPGGGGLAQLPAGVILPFGGPTAPNGTVLCNGAAYSRTVRVKLFEAIGTKYGAPDAATFNVPNFQKRVPVGVDPTDVDFNDLGKTGGAKTTPHTHPFSGGTGNYQGSLFDQYATEPGSPKGAIADHTHSFSGTTGGASDANNMQPFVTVHYLITTG